MRQGSIQLPQVIKPNSHALTSTPTLILTLILINTHTHTVPSFTYTQIYFIFSGFAKVIGEMYAQRKRKGYETERE